jgi:glycosyltransferase involved in cell wall biosynthesis
VEVHGLGRHEAILSADQARLRIACSGLVGSEHGSAASMGFEVLQELLRRGHVVDFFSKRAYVYPEPLLRYPGFNYHDCDQPLADRLISYLRPESVQWFGMRLGNVAYMRRVVRTMARCHRHRSYDCELFLGQWAYGRVPEVPVVSWVQGAPGTDSRSVIRHAATIRKLCGWKEYAKLRAYSGYRGSRFGRPPFEATDISICGSVASKDLLVALYGLSPLKIRVLPYPIDLEAFRPAAGARAGPTAELLWVGRIVPRKRLDLFLDAGARLIQEGCDVRLAIVGGFPFARGYRELIERFPFPARLTYAAHLSRSDVRRRMQTASVLVQPSEEEDFGSSIAEALACGTPVVVGPSNGTRAYIGDGGACFEEYSADSVARAIGRVLALIAAYDHALPAEARKAALEHFSINRIVDGLEAILRAAAQHERGMRDS